MPFNPSFQRTAFITMVLSDSYVAGALVLYQSLKKLTTEYQIVCMVTPNVSSDSIKVLEDCFDKIHRVNLLDSRDRENLKILGRPELGPTLTKLKLWTLQEFYDKLIYLDSDMIAIKNIDELFKDDFGDNNSNSNNNDSNDNNNDNSSNNLIAACPDMGWPDCFNSGLLILKPDQQVYLELLEMMEKQGSFDGGDQGLLNQYFYGKWKKLSFLYNMTFSSNYEYMPAFNYFKNQVKVVHFIGVIKPWMANRYINHPLGEYYTIWWSIHDEFVKPKYLQGDHASGFMCLYNCPVNRSYFNPSSSAPIQYSHSSSDAEFVNYRIKWNNDVEKLMEKKHKQIAIRSLHEKKESQTFVDEFENICLKK